MVHARMANKRRAGLAARTGDHIDHARRKARRLDDLRQQKCRQRRLLSRFGHHRAARCQSRCDAACRSGQGVIPGDDMRRHPNRLVHGVGQVIRAQWNRVAVELVAGPGVKIKAGRCSANIALGLDQALTAVQRLGHRQ